MATGFGCFVVGPAGSGKVSATIFVRNNPPNIYDYYLVNNVSHTATISRDSRQNDQGL